MAKVVPRDVGLVITRAGRQDARRIEILLSKAQGGLPTTPLTTDEHPCEGAWRLAKSTLGKSECVAYRALGAPDATGLQWFQTACEDDLPEVVFGPNGDALTWQPLDLSTVPEAVKAALLD